MVVIIGDEYREDFSDSVDPFLVDSGCITMVNGGFMVINGD